MISVDLHLHTKYSGDASISPKQVVDSLYAHSTIRGVAVTDHDILEGYFQVRKLAAAYEDLVIIPGVEVSTRQGHLILLGIEEKPAYLPPLESIVDFARKRAGLILIPHPYRVHGIGDAAENVPADAVETINPWASPNENKLAEKLAVARKLPGVAGSDAHTSDQMWKAYTQVDADPNVESILEAIKKGRAKAMLAQNLIK